MKYSTAVHLALLVGWSAEKGNSFNPFGVPPNGRRKAPFGRTQSSSKSATPHPPDKPPAGEVFQAQDTYFATPAPSSSADDSEGKTQNDNAHDQGRINGPSASAAKEETDAPAPVPDTVEPWLSDEQKEELNAAATKFVADVWSPLFKKEVQRGVPGETIKGAALFGASLAFLASKGMVVTSAAGLSAAYVAISQGIAGDVARTVGGIAWDVTETATKLYDMATSNDERRAGLSKELADQVFQAVKVSENRAATLQEMETSTESTTTELEEASEAFIESQGELARVLAEAEDAIGAADEAIAQANLTLLAESDLEMMSEEEEDAARLAEEETMRIAEETERRKAEEEKLAAEEEARLKEEAEAARLLAEQKSEEARLLAEQKVEEERLRDELRQAEDEVRRQEEEARVASTTDVEEEQESTDDDWLAAVSMAQDGLDGKIVGLDEAITDDSAKADWDAAGMLAEELRMGGVDENDDDDEEETLDLEALGRAARAAVESFEAEMGLIGDLSTEEDSDLDAADDMLPEGDLQDIALAARRAVEAFDETDEAEEVFEASNGGEEDYFEEYDDTDMEAAEDLLPDGDLEAIAEAARLAVSTFGADEDEDIEEDEFEGFEEGDFIVSNNAVDAQVSSKSPVPRDWSSLSVTALKAELRARDLKAYGRKAELVALLEADDLEKFGKFESEGASDAEEFLYDEDDESSSDTDDDFMDLEDFDMDELGRQARAAVELGKATDLDDEPSDEALKQLESEESILLEMSEPVEAKAIDYSSMTVAQLKDELRSRGLKVSGRKAELIERLKSA